MRLMRLWHLQSSMSKQREPFDCIHLYLFYHLRSHLNRHFFSVTMYRRFSWPPVTAHVREMRFKYIL